MISNQIEKLGFEKGFLESTEPSDLNSFNIERVMAVHKDSYTINNGETDVFAELVEK